MPKRTRRDVLLSGGRLFFGFDYGSSGEYASDFLRSTLRNMANQYNANHLKPMNLQELSATVTSLIATMLYCHESSNQMLPWVRSGLFLAQQDFRAYPEHERLGGFVHMILNMKLPTEKDLEKCGNMDWRNWDAIEQPSLTAFLEKTDRLLRPIEISLKVYFRGRMQGGGGTDGRDQPFLTRIEVLESELKLSGNGVDHANLRLRFKHIVRGFLRRKMRFCILNIKIKRVFTDWAEEIFFKTAHASTGYLMSG